MDGTKINNSKTKVTTVSGERKRIQVRLDEALIGQITRKQDIELNNEVDRRLQ